MTGIAKNHHFVPQLLQRQWANSKGLVQCWNWQDGKLVTFETNPKRVMSETHLYRAEHIDDSGVYETAFSQMESNAESVLLKFRDPTRPQLTKTDFESWAVFLLAQRARVPNKIEWAKHHSFNGFAEVFERHDPEFDRLNPDTRFSTPADYMEEYHPNVLANFHLHTMFEIFCDPKNVKVVLRMHWFVLRNFPHPILLSDDPVVLVGDLHSDHCLIALPISPDEIFFAVSTQAMVSQLLSASRKSIAVAMNQNQSTQAQRILIGSAMPGFIEKRLRKFPVEFQPSDLPSSRRQAE